MRFFKRRSAKSEPEAGPRECTFCGADGAVASLAPLSDKYHRPHGHACLDCRVLYSEFEGSLIYVDAPGHRPWLVSDPGTEHIVRATQNPSRLVYAAMADLGGRIIEISPAAATMMALKNGVWGAGPVTYCDSREGAVTAVGEMIAATLREQHARVQEYLDGREYRDYTLALFGRGSGVMLQEVTTDGDWLRQHCFLVDTTHSVHRYKSYDR